MGVDLVVVVVLVNIVERPLTPAIDQFRAAMRARGIEPGEIIADGVLHTCAVVGSDKLKGNYLFHLDAFPAGGFNNYLDGIGWERWKASGTARARPADVEAMRRAAAKREEDAAARARHGAVLAKEMWDKAKPLPRAARHRYLELKGVWSFGLRVLHGELLVPVRVGGVLTSLQRIGPSGGKRFLKGGVVVGGYHSVGKLSKRVFVAEGYATGAAVHMATGSAVAVAFSSANLLKVAQALRSRRPEVEIVLVADDDWLRFPNIGLEAAHTAADAVGGRVVVPDFGPETGRSNKDTDFADQLLKHGTESVTETIARQLDV